MSFIASGSQSIVFVACRFIGKDLHVSVHSFYFAMTSSLIGFFLLAFSSKYSLGVLNLKDGLLLVFCGLCSWIQQEAMSMALQIEKGGRSAAVNYLIVVNAFLADILLFGEDIRITDFLGALCIVFFTFLNAFLKCFGKTK